MLDPRAGMISESYPKEYRLHCHTGVFLFIAVILQNDRYGLVWAASW